jgi:nucleotide-binding universal stress UspA family protein
MIMAGRVRRLLVAYDAGHPAAMALELGIEIAAATGAAIGIVTVVPEPTEPPDDPWSETSERAAELYLAKLRAAEAGLVAQTHLPTGVPGPQIVEVAAAFGYDTIVIGSRRLGPIRRTLLGSVSRYVATHSRSTTIIAR